MYPLKNIFVTSTYGWRIHPILKERRYHQGVDLRAPEGTEVLAITSGKVIFAGYNGAYGNTVKLDHGGGVVSFYAHCSAFKANAGESVAEGRVIALSGNTGLSTAPHLHFGIYLNGESVDPLKYIEEVLNLDPVVIRKEGQSYQGFIKDGVAYGPLRDLFESQGQEVVWRSNPKEVVITPGPLDKLRDIQKIVEGVK